MALYWQWLVKGGVIFGKEEGEGLAASCLGCGVGDVAMAASPGYIVGYWHILVYTVLNSMLTMCF